MPEHKQVRFLIFLSALLWGIVFQSDAAFRFGLANSVAKRGSNIVNEVLPGNLALILPINPAHVDFSGQVIWPYGARGWGHPEGHPGIDFDLEVGAPVYASATGKVREVSAYSVHSGSGTETLIIIDHAFYSTVYVGSLQNVTLSVGSFVVQGQKIADLGQWALSQNRQYGFIHWGVNSFATQRSVCPSDFLNSAAKTELERMLIRAIYPDKDQFPNLCNPCPACR